MHGDGALGRPRPKRELIVADKGDEFGVIPPVPRYPLATYIYADNMAELSYLMDRDCGRIFLPQGRLSARDMVIPVYTEMLNRFKGDYACVSQDWAVHFNYLPDISTPLDAYRLVYYLAPRMGLSHFGPDLVWLCGCGLYPDGFHLSAQDYEIVIKVNQDVVQRAIERRKEKAETDTQRHYRPLP